MESHSLISTLKKKERQRTNAAHFFSFASWEQLHQSLEFAIRIVGRVSVYVSLAFSRITGQISCYSLALNTHTHTQIPEHDFDFVFLSLFLPAKYLSLFHKISVFFSLRIISYPTNDSRCVQSYKYTFAREQTQNTRMKKRKRLSYEK